MHFVKYIYIIFFTFALLACYAQKKEFSFEGSFEEEGFAVKFMDSSPSEDGGIVFSGRVEYGDHDTHSKRYAYDVKKYPEYLQQNAPSGLFPTTILHKVNARGDSLWTRLYATSLQGTAVAPSKDGGFVVTGFKPTQREKAYKNDNTQAVTCMKVGKSGNLEWFKLIPSNYNSTSADVLTLASGAILILADREYAPVSDFSLNPAKVRLLKLTKDGKLLWDKTLPLSASEANWCYSSQMLTDEQGNIFIVGSIDTKQSIYIMKVDSSGKILKTKAYNWKTEYSNENNWGFSIALLSDGLVFSGSAYQGKKRGQHIVKVNKDLRTQWEAIQEAEPLRESRLVSNTRDEIYFAGTSENKTLLLAKYSPKGELLWEKTFDNTELFEVGSLISNKADYIVIAGSKHTSGRKNWQGLYFKLNSKGEK